MRAICLRQFLYPVNGHEQELMMGWKHSPAIPVKVESMDKLSRITDKLKEIRTIVREK
ncbi:hypothetical protein [Chryseobacterium sp. MFBS3-17]|uniref:hypothetical protein n=1 Tax=Chryseobacterium sp. MFBS3-17 TaxID=2886689 RepID=UPI001D0E3319|nr:hypothetical protein [Chryseobacterium sp. MFBS3-17]MCC2589930.1 hypothetical protein [Chryseobacterium sp. MFBS3-17]